MHFCLKPVSSISCQPYREGMAYIVDRVGKPRGKKKPEISYQVKWNMGNKTGSGRGSETFHDPKRAEHFKSAVELAGGNYPPNFIPGGGDEGWVDDETYRRYTNALAEPATPAPTVAEFANEVISSLSGIQGSTRKTYRGLVAHHILPWFGDVPIDDAKAISPITVGAWVNDLADGVGAPGYAEERKPLKPKSIRNVHGIFYSIMQAAVDAEPPWRSLNPLRKTNLPNLDNGEEDGEMMFLTMGEFDTIYAHLDDDAKDLAEFLATTGLRYSEATAVQVRDLDLLSDRPRLRVQRAWKRQESGPWKLGAPKTAKSRRGVALSARQVDRLLPLVAGKKPKDLVFEGPRGGRWNHATYYHRRWRVAVYRATRCEYHRHLDWEQGMRVLQRKIRNNQMEPCGCPGVLDKLPRIHDLRHTHVSWLIAKNLPLPAIQRRLGHESIQTTIDRYGHLLPELDDDMVAAVDSFMLREQVPAVVA